MTWKKSAITLFILAVLITACGNSAPQEMAVKQVASAPMADMAVVMEESAAGLAYRDDAEFGEDVELAQAGAQPRLIIRTADMSIVVSDTEQAMAGIAQMAEDNDGWIVSSNVFQFDETAKTGNMTVRIPADGFQSFIDAVQLMSVEVTRISTSGQDVTEEYVDLSARLRNLEATADRVRAFLDETKNVEEALAVNQELSRLEGEIEVLKGRIKYLEQSSAFSTVTIDLTPDILSQPIEVGGWQPQGVAKSALESLIAALQTLVDIAIWLLIFLLPVLLIIALPIWLLVVLVRRWRRRRKAKRSATQEESQELDQVETQESVQGEPLEPDQD
jgi:large-conductance mechanosensitive channel